jgi:metal-dependent amidase/aminoacylase/carboxypeptidase family protein
MYMVGIWCRSCALARINSSWKTQRNCPVLWNPAEEDLAKVYMARAGLFNDLDVCLDWHPDYENKANMQSSQAIADYTITFKGKSAHAAADPWNGRSALDAAELLLELIS